METFNITYEVWRVEDRWNPDGIDFWDFPDEETANEFITVLEDEGDEIQHTLTLRKLGEDELIQTSLDSYKDLLQQRNLP